MTGHGLLPAGVLAAVIIATWLAARIRYRAAIRWTREQAYWDGVEATARAHADHQERLWQKMGYPPAGPPPRAPAGRHEAPRPALASQGPAPDTSEWAAALIAEVETWNGRHQLNGGTA